MTKHHYKTVLLKQQQVQSTAAPFSPFKHLPRSITAQSKLGGPPKESKTAQLKQHRQTFP